MNWYNGSTSYLAEQFYGIHVEIIEDQIDMATELLLQVLKSEAF